MAAVAIPSANMRLGKTLEEIQRVYRRVRFEFWISQMEILMQDLISAKVHLGHQSRKWNPKMKPFIHSKEAGSHIINLDTTRVQLEKACEFMKQKALENLAIVFVGTKRQAAQAILEEAKRAGAYFINNRWIGGLLTNFENVRRAIARLEEDDEKLKPEVFATLSTKEKYRLMKDRARLEKLVGGLRGLEKAPEVLYIVDPKREETAVHEANRRNVPTVALVDTNGDPSLLTIPIPGNDDSLRSIRLITKVIADAIIEGRKSN